MVGVIEGAPIMFQVSNEERLRQNNQLQYILRKIGRYRKICIQETHYWQFDCVIVSVTTEFLAGIVSTGVMLLYVVTLPHPQSPPSNNALVMDIARGLCDFVPNQLMPPGIGSNAYDKSVTIKSIIIYITASILILVLQNVRPLCVAWTGGLVSRPFTAVHERGFHFAIVFIGCLVELENGRFNILPHIDHK